MKFTQLSIFVGLLLLQIATSFPQDQADTSKQFDFQNMDESSSKDKVQVPLSDAPQPDSPPEENPTRATKTPDATLTFPPLVHGNETTEKELHKTDGNPPRSTDSPATTTPGAANNLYQSIVLICGISSILYFV